MNRYNIMGWKEREYSKNQINKTGRKMILGNLIDDEKTQTLKIISNYRSSHAYPLYVIANKLRRMLRIDYNNRKNMFVVYRLNV